MCIIFNNHLAAKCDNTTLDILYVVDGSGSVQEVNFATVKKFINGLNANFDIGANKTQIALMQFGTPSRTRIEFNLGEKTTLKDVDQGVEEMKYLKSWTATGDALRKSREEVRFLLLTVRQCFTFKKGCVSMLYQCWQLNSSFTSYCIKSWRATVITSTSRLYS